MGELPGPDLVCQNFNGSLVEVDIVGSATEGNILTDGHEVSRVADSPIHRISGVPGGGGVAISVIWTVGRFEIMKEILGMMTGVTLRFAMDLVDFPRGMRIHSHRWCSVISCFGMTIWPRRHEYCRMVDMCRCRIRRFSRVQQCR